jgi:hypothetical protein
MTNQIIDKYPKGWLQNDTYQLLPLKEVLKFEKTAEANKVSIIARSPKGFLYYYKKNQGKLEDPFWIKKRNSFLARTLSAYYKNPTFRRWLSIVMWAFWTEPIHFKKNLNII